MELPTEEEQRRWRELAAELRHDRRLAAHSVRFDAVIRLRRNLAAARDGSAVPAITWMPALAGACVGLALVIAGLVAHSSSRLITDGIAVLVTTTVLTGIALLAIGAAGAWNAGRPDKRQ